MALDAHTHRQPHTRHNDGSKICNYFRNLHQVYCDLSSHRAIAYFSFAFIHRLHVRSLSLSSSRFLNNVWMYCTLAMIMIEIKDEQTRNRKQNIDLVGKCRSNASGGEKKIAEKKRD